ncbi:hypothetical protein [Falsirhodobacter halotolerans]|uniref:hypothetical protein n=1 Tax=Falsirhodobacter halotolerans TaxID=1146892 RepID=UPI001FD049B8|nr:hypothetical protein [Falsirhodobacter halotolerans]MCJ8138947.1 hypothetical protein [Falsirhodobacter halotolerans]
MRGALILALALAACGPRPDIGPLPADDGPAPTLLPQAQIDARIGDNLTDVQTQTDLDARGAALRARAAALR